MDGMKEMDLETIKDLKDVLLFARNTFKGTSFMWECENEYSYELFYNNLEDSDCIDDTIVNYIADNYYNKKWTNSLIINFDAYKNILPNEDIIHHISHTQHIDKSY